ncbi:MAG: hypothetical protein HYX72_05175 [Acidobacteria bacterium]|nr:hypothetical protein [Acidobacteriota bacterium]
MNDFKEGKTVVSQPQPLERVRFEKGDGDGYSERWLQELVSRNPMVLPIKQIEPALTPAFPICMELPLDSGFADVLYATPDGDLIVAETKLFRNPEARRKVIGQVIDYAKDLSRLSYEKLDEAILRAEAPDGTKQHPKCSLYQTVASYPREEELIEEQFIDSVSRNLKRGRFLLLVIGDGIQEGTENLTTFLQQHAGMHFMLGLIELAIFKLPADNTGYLVQPRILAKTKNIERGIVAVENGNVTVKPPVQQKIGSITEEKFYEELGGKFPAIPTRLKAFVGQLESNFRIETDFGKNSMILRWRPDEELVWNFATIRTSGKVWTDVLSVQANTAGLGGLAHKYFEQLVALVPGAYVKEVSNASYVAKGGTYITIDQLLKKENGWMTAIQEFTTAVSDALKRQQP